MNKKIKILISTHSAALHSGLSETTRHIFIPLLSKYPDKYEVHQLGFFHYDVLEQVPWPIYKTMEVQTPQGLQPDPEDRFGQKSFDKIAAQIKPDIVFGYGDMWHFEHLLHSPLRNSYKLLCYYTIDGQPYFGHLNADESTDWGQKLTKADSVVVLSSFGREVLTRGNKELANMDIKVMYHPIDTPRYPVLSREERFKVKDKILPKHLSRDSFICGFVGKNQFRKQNYKLWEIAHYIIHGDYIECKDCNRITRKEWNHTTRTTKDPDKFPGELDKITLYDHSYRYNHCWYCKSTNIMAGIPNPKFYLWFHMGKDDPGYNADLHHRMWKVENNCIYNKGLKALTGIKAKDLALVMASWDCMLYPSGGEGYGNPAAECMAAGTPVVYSDYSSHSEFCQFGGLPIRCEYIPELAHGIQRAVVDTNHAIEQMLKLIRNPDYRDQLGNSGREYMMQYSIPYMIDPWDNIFSELYNRNTSKKLYTTLV